MALGTVFSRAAQVLVCACLFLAPTSARTAAPEHPALGAFIATEFELIGRLADLPVEVRKALDIDAYPMAESGGDWNPGCVVDGRPGRRFIFAGKSPHLWFVYFEKGGRSHYRAVVTLRRDQAGRLAKEGNWTFSLVVKTLQELKTAVQASAQRRQHP